ncbi:hypothetical protein BLEM_0113 [Bifidobacterium lemurum]|uniref:DUF624 domain-containing protein n=1 Tax=Bifidobacterium lemurum TaxID=1603886 RepID=A0A261FW51_9BIFI|nr:DUF624 domain-containing protein [Bifidobacterium lemurum]OZG63410.1 hypothetical protein BLEM_0113 [Bifidobacterium lemurum]QOL34315.1 DUF624 domain-containing protein [Bifidobacterium lemurum]
MALNLYGLFYGGSSHESDRQRDPKGVALLLCVVKWHWSRLVGLNLLFLLTCVPVVTIPCAMASMSRVAGLLVRRKVCYPVHDYLTTFRTEWKRSTLAGWAMLLVLAAALLGVWFYPRVHPGTPGMMAAGLLLVVAVLDACAMMYLFPMVAFTDLPVGKLLANSVLLLSVRLPQSLLALAATLALIALSWAGQLATVWVMPLIGFSLIGLIGVHTAWPALRRHVIVDDPDPAAAKTA